MKGFAITSASGILVVLAGAAAQFSQPQAAARVALWSEPRPAVVATEPTREAALSNEALTEVVRRVCGACHSDRLKTGNLSLQHFDVATAAATAETTEKMITKLRAGMMPPPGTKPPGGDTLQALVETLERLVDHAAATRPESGGRTFQRLNRAEYERSIRDLLTLEVDAGAWLPLDTKSANFDNIADVQMPSATLLDAYLDAASEISRLAVGDPQASVASHTYKIPRLASQWHHVEGAPIGTRGGVSVMHTFPADGEYVFAVSLHAIPTGQLFGSDAPFDEKVEISINGDRVGLIEVDRLMSQSDPNGMEIRTSPVRVRAGAQRISAAFVKTFDGPVNDLLAMIAHSIADTQIGSEYGITNVPHLQSFAVSGPYNSTGVSETASRRKIFSCRPTAPAEARPCAEKIVSRLGGAAYRRPLSQDDLKGLMPFYEQGAKSGGFEIGIRTAIEALLASPHFIFRLEEPPARAKAGERYAVSDVDLASRLSFFLWGMPPDEPLMQLASRGALSDLKVLEAQARRMLEDPRSEALATRFAAQWLRLQDIEKVHPDALQFPDFHDQLANAMQQETEQFFYSIVREDRSLLDLFTADYTYMNETLAEHYGVAGITGNEFQRVTYPDDSRKGLFGHASILTLTSHANRTSPVLRGKWVMEVLLGTPPPPPPPGVPDLEKTEEAKEGRLLTTRERMELHRSNPTCRSCHQYMDPIGLALDNFDVTGKWRIRENGMPLDTKGQLYDGSPVSTPAELQQALLRRPIPLVRNFTQNLMAYALGRRVEYYDQPTVRAIASNAARRDYRMSEFVLGIVKSDAFRMKRVPVAALHK
ncbi:MAG: DUF1592 domain-containing protein [Gemmatimonadota bacterium]